MITHNLSLSTAGKPTFFCLLAQDLFSNWFIHSFPYSVFIICKVQRQKDTLTLREYVMWQGILERYFKTRWKLLWEDLEYRNQNQTWYFKVFTNAVFIISS